MIRTLLTAALLLAPIAAVHAVITIGPRQIVDDADFLAGGRAEYIGRFGPFTGTPISPRHFITATHLGNAGGGTFEYANGTTTETTYNIVQAGTLDDLTIWELAPAAPSFTRWTPLYTAGNEVGLPLRVLGRGTSRGAEVRVPDTTAGQLRGYRWGVSDGYITWGDNVVTSIVSFSPPFGGFGGDFLYFEFDQSGGPSECMLSNGDSGGPVFITDPADGVRKLAAVNSLVDGNFSYAAAGPFFPGAIWDARGMYVGDVGNATLIPSGEPNPVPAGSYSTQISSRMAFIMGIIGPALPRCGTADFDGDGDVGTDGDIEAFFACLGGNCCATCFSGGADFNADGDTGTDADIEAFFRVLAGGNC